MVDAVDRTTRSRMMAGIRSKNTQPELAVRSVLHRSGLRVELHDSCIPGTPDLILPRYSAVIFVNGCFWHMHECDLFKWPKTRPKFWKHKLEGNKRRDHRDLTHCLEQGWRVLTIWECSLKGPTSRGIDEVGDECLAWLKSSYQIGIISGRSGSHTSLDTQHIPVSNKE